MAIYSDLNMNTPSTNPLVYDDDAIKQSVETIMAVIKGDVPFLPAFGADTEDYLFEPVDETGALIIFQSLVNNINAWDPRIKLDMSNSTVYPNYDDNSYSAVVAFSIVGSSTQYSPITTIIKK